MRCPTLRGTKTAAKTMSPLLMRMLSMGVRTSDCHKNRRRRGKIRRRMSTTSMSCCSRVSTTRADTTYSRSLLTSLSKRMWCSRVIRSPPPPSPRSSQHALTPATKTLAKTATLSTASNPSTRVPQALKVCES